MSAGVDAGLREGGRTAPAGGGVGEVDAAGVAVLERLAVAEHGGAGPPELAGHVGVDDDERRRRRR